MFGNFGFLSKTQNIFILLHNTSLHPLAELEEFERLKWSVHGGKPFLPLVSWIENFILHLNSLFLNSQNLATPGWQMDALDVRWFFQALMDTSVSLHPVSHTQTHTQLTPLPPLLEMAQNLCAMPYNLLLLQRLIHLPLCSCSSQLLSTLKSPLRPERSDWSSHHSPFLFSLHSD